MPSWKERKGFRKKGTLILILKEEVDLLDESLFIGRKEQV